MVDTKSLSRSTEDYLKAIYKLEQQHGAAQTSAIAEALEIAAPSVSGMVKRLSEAGLLEHSRYRGVQLTDPGRRAALRMLRRHRILELYLIEKLNYDWDTVHVEAELLEHAVSDLLIERMAAALGNPRYDPHGAPIPSVLGEVEQQHLIPLTEVPSGSWGELRRVSDEDPDRLRFLGSLGLKPRVRFVVTGRQPFNGPITVRLEGTHSDQVVGFELAQALGCSIVEVGP